MKLWTLNRVFRMFGFVLVVSTPDPDDEDQSTRLYFMRVSKYNSQTFKKG